MTICVILAELLLRYSIEWLIRLVSFVLNVEHLLIKYSLQALD